MNQKEKIHIPKEQGITQDMNGQKIQAVPAAGVRLHLMKDVKLITSRQKDEI